MLTVGVHSAAKTLVATTFIRLQREWIAENTCMQLLERLLRENGHIAIADKLGDCEVHLTCARTVGVQNRFAKRGRATEEIKADTFLLDPIADALELMEAEELTFNLSTPAAP